MGREENRGGITIIKETYCSCKLVRLIKENRVVIAEHTKYITMLKLDLEIVNDEPK